MYVHDMCYSGTPLKGQTLYIKDTCLGPKSVKLVLYGHKGHFFHLKRTEIISPTVSGLERFRCTAKYWRRLKVSFPLKIPCIVSVHACV